MPGGLPVIEGSMIIAVMFARPNALRTSPTVFSNVKAKGGLME